MSVLVFSSLAVGPPRMPRMRMVVVRWNWGECLFQSCCEVELCWVAGGKTNKGLDLCGIPRATYVLSTH